MTHTAHTGDTIRLSELSHIAGHIKVNVHWRLLPDLKNPPEGDLFCFMRDRNGHAPTNEDFVFFNNMQSAGDTAVLTAPVVTDSVEASQTLILHLSDIRYEITELLVGFNLYRADERDQSFRFLDSLAFSVELEDNTPLLRHEYPLEKHKTATGSAALKFIREGNDWLLAIVDETYMGFNDIARAHGIVVTT